MRHCTNYLGCNSNNFSHYSKDQDLVFETCGDCGLIWRSIDSADISKPYEQEYFDSKSYNKNRNHKIEKSGWLIDLAKMQHPQLSRLLEVGCSIGNTLEAAKLRNIDHLGIDVSKFAVDFCNKNGLNAKNASLTELNNSNEKFDLIYMQHVLEHFRNPFEVLAECNNLLNKNGLILIVVPNSDYYRAKKHKEKHRFYSISGVGTEHYVYFNYKNLVRVLQASGFTCVQQDYPVFAGNNFNLVFFMNRLFRRATAIFNANQEILLIARKN